jgi:tetratricopeptide (TPR) repeat protein
MAIARDRLPFKLAAAAITFVLVFAAVRAIDGAGSAPLTGGTDVGVREGLLPTASTDERIAALQAQAGDAPDDPAGFGRLGQAYLQKARESGDSSYYPRAEQAFERALELDPDEFTATSGLGSLALARHDFREALSLGERAAQINPAIARNYGVIADAQIELGRYQDAERTLRRYVNMKPELSSYARISYFRELHGDLPGALAAMELAVSAGGESPENYGYVQSLVGKLHFDRGDYPAAESAYRAALARVPGYPAAVAGLARTDAAQGNLDAAIERYRGLARTLPLPEYVIALGEVEQAAGLDEQARRDYALVAAEAALLNQNGVNTDAELAVFEADHGSPERAVELAASAYRAAPSVRSADAYSWALSAAGRDRAGLRYSSEAMRLGSVDPSFLYHAGVVSLRAGAEGRARELLGRLVAQTPGFSPLYGPSAERSLERLR